MLKQIILLGTSSYWSAGIMEFWNPVCEYRNEAFLIVISFLKIVKHPLCHQLITQGSIHLKPKPTTSILYG